MEHSFLCMTTRRRIVVRIEVCLHNRVFFSRILLCSMSVTVNVKSIKIVMAADCLVTNCIYGISRWLKGFYFRFLVHRNKRSCRIVYPCFTRTYGALYTVFNI